MPIIFIVLAIIALFVDFDKTVKMFLLAGLFLALNAMAFFWFIASMFI